MSERSLASEKDPFLELLPHKLNRVKKLLRVRPEDFDVKRLMAAAREGRLYVDECRNEVSREEVIAKVRAYVARIRVFVTLAFRSSVDELWEQILVSDSLVDFLMPGTKARKCRDFDKYNVMRIIGVLRDKGVYEQYSDRKYDALLEPDVKESPYRRYLGMGIDKRELLVEIRKIVEKYDL